MSALLPNFKIGYVGRLSTGKRFQDLIAAIGLLGAHSDFPPLSIKLSVAGNFVDQAFEAQIHAQIHRLISQKMLQPDTVRFLGHQPDLTSFWPQIDLLVLPSLNEPFGRVLIEAMDQGVLCAGANSGGIPEILGEGLGEEICGFLFPPQAPSALAQVIQEAAGLSPAKRVTILQNARRRVQERFTIKVQVQQILTLYADCLV